MQRFDGLIDRMQRFIEGAFLSVFLLRFVMAKSYRLSTQHLQSMNEAASFHHRYVEVAQMKGKDAKCRLKGQQQQVRDYQDGRYEHFECFSPVIICRSAVRNVCCDPVSHGFQALHSTYVVGAENEGKRRAHIACFVFKELNTTDFLQLTYFPGILLSHEAGKRHSQRGGLPFRNRRKLSETLRPRETSRPFTLSVLRLASPWV